MELKIVLSHLSWFLTHFIILKYLCSSFVIVANIFSAMFSLLCLFSLITLGARKLFQMIPLDMLIESKIISICFSTWITKRGTWVVMQFNMIVKITYSWKIIFSNSTCVANRAHFWKVNHVDKLIFWLKENLKEIHNNISSFHQFCSQYLI